MIKFKEELKKFKPSLEVENIEGDYMADLLDIIKQIIPEDNKIEKE